MNDHKIPFYGSVDDEGKLRIHNRKDFDKTLLAFKGKDIEGFYWKKRKRRSLNQNRYLWGVIYPMMAQGFRDMGHEDVTTSVVHEFCKARFISSEDQEIASPLSGELIVLKKTTTKLTTTLMMGYIADIHKFASEFLGIVIPDPDPLFSLDGEGYL